MHTEEAVQHLELCDELTAKLIPISEGSDSVLLSILLYRAQNDQLNRTVQHIIRRGNTLIGFTQKRSLRFLKRVICLYRFLVTQTFLSVSNKKYFLKNKNYLMKQFILVVLHRIVT